METPNTRLKCSNIQRADFHFMCPLTASRNKNKTKAKSSHIELFIKTSLFFWLLVIICVKVLIFLVDYFIYKR